MGTESGRLIALGPPLGGTRGGWFDERFCVSNCITRPQIAMAAPERTSAMVRGMRVIPNISQPNSLLKMLYSPTESETISNSATPRDASVSFQSHSLPRERRIGVFNSGLDAGALAACDELTEFSIIFNFFQTKNRLRPLELYPKGQPVFIA